MPENPFGGGIGSRGEQRATQAQARAVRAYSAQLKRLLGMEQALGNASEARVLAASRAIQEHNKAIGRTSSLLDDQGKTLKNLDRVRQRYHDAEIERTKSLAFHYEKAKQFLTELREDTDDTSTVLGTFTRGWKDGIDNMLRYGKLPEASQQIRDVSVDINDLSGTIGDAVGAAGDLGSGMLDQFGRVNKLRQNMARLDDELRKVEVSYNLVEGSGRKLGQQIVQMAAVDIGGGDGAIAQVAKLADQLTVLNTIAGVTAEQGMQFAIERTQQVGGSMSDAMEDVERFSAMADSMSAHLKRSNIGMTRFTFAVREDFVKAMMEARRMIKGQVADLENVGAAYQWAARKAVEYGSSAEGAGKFAKAWGKMVFGEAQKISWSSMLAGQRLQARTRDALKAFKAQQGIQERFESMTDAQQQAAQEFVAKRLGVRGEGPEGALTREQLAPIRESMTMRGEGGLAPAQVQAMLGTTRAGIASMLEAQRATVGGLDTTTLSEVLKGEFGLDLSTLQARMLAQSVRGGDIGEAVDEIMALREQAEAATAEANPRAALTAVLAMRDPVQELFNIKNLLKALVLNVDTILGVLNRLDPTGTVSRIREYTRDLLGTQTGEAREEAEERKTKLQEQGTDLQSRFVEAHQELAAATNDGEKERIGVTISDLNRQIVENTVQRGEVAEALTKLVQERGLLEAGGGGGAGSPVDVLRQITGGEGEGGLSAALAGGAGFIASMLGEGAPGSAAAATARGARQIGAGATGATGAAGKRAAPGPSPGGAMDAVGNGTVTVGADGRAIMTVRMTIGNMQEVVAHANTELQQGITNFFS